MVLIACAAFIKVKNITILLGMVALFKKNELSPLLAPRSESTGHF
jgi:hypothetical protein